MNEQTAIEPDLIFPLLRGRDIRRWLAIPTANIIMAQDPVTRRGIDGYDMKMKYPKTLLYLKKFEKELRDRAVFKRFFTRKPTNGAIVETGPFYSMFGIGNYTFLAYKVVWPWISVGVRAAVVTNIDEKVIIPEHNTSFVGCSDEREAYFICGLMNSSIGDYFIRTFYSGGGGGIGSPSVMQKINIPKFDLQNDLHLKLAYLSEEAHLAARKKEEVLVKKAEKEIDEIAAIIWGLSEDELKEIQTSLQAKSRINITKLSSS
jgi:hypothetical protein